MGAAWGLAQITIWMALACGTAAYAQSPCDAAAGHGIADCRAEGIPLRAGDWNGQSRIVSDVLPLDPARIYWACCAADAAGNPSADLQRGIYLVVLPDKRMSDETVVDACSAAIDVSVDQRSTEGGDSLWAPDRSAEAMIVGWSDPALVDRSAVCREVPPQIDAGAAPVGAVVVVSVPATSIPDEK